MPDLLAEHAVRRGDRAVRPEVRQHREREAVLVGERPQRVDRVGRDREQRHLVAEHLELALLQLLQLAAADPRERPRVEDDQGRLAAAQGREPHGLAVLVLELEVRCLVADRRCHRAAPPSALAGCQCGSRPALCADRALRRRARPRVLGAGRPRRRSSCPRGTTSSSWPRELDLDGPTRLTGWTARDVCVHLGSWPGSRSFLRMRDEAERDEAAADWTEHRAATFDQDAHNEAVLAARGRAPRADVLAALQESRAEVAAFLGSDEASALGGRPVRSVLGPLPLNTLVGAGRLRAGGARAGPGTGRRAGRRPRRCSRRGWPPSSTRPVRSPPAARSRPVPPA